MTSNQFTEMDRFFKMLFRLNQKWFKIRRRMSHEMEEAEAQEYLQQLFQSDYTEIEGILDAFIGERESPLPQKAG